MTESEELARALRATARNAATTALRAGLEEIDARHGARVADEVAALIDVAGVYAGLADREVPAHGSDDEPWEYRPLTS
ncbi:hypothetical protein VA596_13180 [Amycolatopsis sp., V23-08]|uniref:Uncharacterized protein n=1 Tax=Amycolatopsis heterodermiae TaxID=3110235 RepID=A0ABU5R2R6_9PSEU|nr:hypothetical protein [Amycolatopsis sp., V23-08]MEA5360493.1 hypothetical protein [Amycolatopsis sp., V23-08]